MLIDPWGAELVEYEKVIKAFGLELFKANSFPEPNRLMRRGVVFAGRDLKRIADAIKKRKEFYALTGIMPTAEKLHFGNKMVVENMRYFQERGAKTFLLVADLEAMIARKISLEEARKRALEFHIPAYIALGLDPKNTIFYFQSENRRLTRLVYAFSRRVTASEFRAIYGTNDPERMLAALTQAADILFPQLEKRMPCIVPVGIDQDPHLRLTRDIVRRTKNEFGFVMPSSIYHKYTPSLDGSMKMSKSKPESCIELPEDSGEVCRKLKKALTGGRETIDEQRKKGGQPEKCVVFELHKQHLIEDDDELAKIFNDCKTGKLLCKECKQIACERFAEFIDLFEKRFEKAKRKVDKLRFISE